MPQATPEPAAQTRHLLHTAETARLATLTAAGPDDGAAGAPYASLVLPAVDWSGAPLVLLSDLAEHTRNAAADPRVCLLVEGASGSRAPLAGPRASVLGTLQPVGDQPALRARYLRYQPSARRYAELPDFRLYRMTVARAHLVAGFGRIAWVAGPELLTGVADAQALTEAEAGIVAHMNDDHADAIAGIAVHLLGAPEGAAPGDWILLGVDPAGADFAAADGRGGWARRAPQTRLQHAGANPGRLSCQVRAGERARPPDRRGRRGMTRRSGPVTRLGYADSAVEEAIQTG